jgi:hypothetical protein
MSEAGGQSKLELIARSLDKVSNVVRPDIDPDGGGVCVLAGKKMKPGEFLVSSYAAGVALDPEHRHLCAYCVRPCIDKLGSRRCDVCKIVSICEKCEAAKKWHESSEECKALSCLVSAHHKLFGGGLDRSFLDKANDVDSSFVLTVRVMFRRWSDCESSTRNNVEIPFPSMDWQLLDQLFTADIGSINEKQHYDSAITALCSTMRNMFCESDQGKSGRCSGSWINKKDFDSIMGKVIGCGHAVTNLTATLGCQCLGRALFLEHSFYNHSCAPNSFLSCHIKREDEGGSYQCALVARLHCIRDIEKTENVSISYIPTSGLDYSERQQRLNESYSFVCKCDACCMVTEWAKDIDKSTALPDGADVSVIRDMQFSCNQQLLDLQRGNNGNPDHSNTEDMQDIQTCMSTIQMNKRGVQNQRIPESHEVAIESHRLHAATLSLSGDTEASLGEHAAFVKSAKKIQEIFDPVALATSMMEYGLDLKKVGRSIKFVEVMTNARESAEISLGKDHAFVKSIEKIIENASNDKNAKKRKSKDLHENTL